MVALHIVFKAQVVVVQLVAFEAHLMFRNRSYESTLDLLGLRLELAQFVASLAVCIASH